MARTYIHELQTGSDVEAAGFIHDLKIQSRIIFLLLRDSTGIVQAVIPERSEAFKTIKSLNRESVIRLGGTVQAAAVKSSDVTRKDLEIAVRTCAVLSDAESGIPIPIAGDVELNKRLDWRYLDLRNPKNLLIFKVGTAMLAAMRDYWIKNGFIELQTPKLMGAPSESGAELFSVDYFGRRAYLAQSPQFYKQMAMAAGFERVFEIAPVFRANPSHTTRHDTEFTSVDMEMGYIESHEDVMRFEEAWIHHVLTAVKVQYGTEIKDAFGVEIAIPSLPFPRMNITEAARVLGEKGHVVTDDLDSEGEKILGQIIKERFNHEFVFIVGYKPEARAFYHMRDAQGITKGFDLLWNGLEITTGAQREHRYEQLKKQAQERNMNLELIGDYLDFFKYGCPPHGGFGLSSTRVLMTLLNLKNVREATFLPRDTDRLRP